MNSAPITGTNYIKNNIANLGNIAANGRRRTRVSRLDSKFSGVFYSEDADGPNSTNAAPTTSTNANTNPSDNETDEDSPKPLVDATADDKDVETPYHKPLPNTAPIGPQQISARAR